MSLGWAFWLLLDAALLVLATATVLALFGRDLHRGIKESRKKKGPP